MTYPQYPGQAPPVGPPQQAPAPSYGPPQPHPGGVTYPPAPQGPPQQPAPQGYTPQPHPTTHMPQQGPPGYPPQGASQQAQPMALPDLNDPTYQSSTSNDYLPYPSGGAGAFSEETCKVVLITQRSDGYKSKNRVVYLLEVLETSRPNEVRVGRQYVLDTDLDKPGSFNAPGTPAHFACIELARFSAATLGMASVDAQAAGINLTQHINHMIAQGEELGKQGITIRVTSKSKQIKDKQTKQPAFKPDGTPVLWTDRFYDPADAPREAAAPAPSPHVSEPSGRFVSPGYPNGLPPTDAPVPFDGGYGPIPGSVAPQPAPAPQGALQQGTWNGYMGS